jgi:hypothetical protein
VSSTGIPVSEHLFARRTTTTAGVRIPVSSANSGLTLVIGVSSFFDEKRTDTNNPHGGRAGANWGRTRTAHSSLEAL